MVYIVLMIVVIVISTGITVYLVYYSWSLIKNNTRKITEIWWVKVYKMGTTKQINIKNWTYYFCNDVIDLENFDAKLLKIDKKIIQGHWYLQYWIYHEEKNWCVNPLYLNITHSNGYIEEKGIDKYLIFDSTDENKQVLKKYNDDFNGIRDKIKERKSNYCDYEKDYMKIKFNSDDDLPLNKSLKFTLMTITISCVFEENGKLYPQVFLDDTLYELNV